jgi:hypothetical protein
MSIRDKIIKADDLGSEVVSIPEWDVKIEVRAKTVAQQYDLIERCRKPNGDINGELLAVETVIATSYDPDTGDVVFDPADRDMLRSKNSAAFQTLLAAANKAAGLAGEEEAVADLDETPPAETSTG